MPSKDKVSPETAKSEFEELVQLELRLAALSVEAKRIADAAGMSRREIAKRMGNSSPSNLQRLLSGMAYSASVETLAKFAWACGLDLKVAFVPRLTARHECHVTSTHDCANNVVDLNRYRERYKNLTQSHVFETEHFAHGAL